MLRMYRTFVERCPWDWWRAEFGGGRKWFIRLADGPSDAEPASSTFDSNIGVDLILDVALRDNWFLLLRRLNKKILSSIIRGYFEILIHSHNQDLS